MANILRAIKFVVKNSISNPPDGGQGRNRINAKGMPLEELIKDIFADTLGESNGNIQVERHSRAFSYLGNQNKPPDLMIKDGDAIAIMAISQI